MILYDNMVITGNRAMTRSFAKINLTLDIVGVLDNGYHSLKSIMQTTNLSDIIIIDKTDGEIKNHNKQKRLAYKQ